MREVRRRVLVCGEDCTVTGVIGVCGAQAWFGGAAGCAAECADLCIGTKGRNIERQGRGEQRKTLRSGINVRNATQRIGKGRKFLSLEEWEDAGKSGFSLI